MWTRKRWSFVTLVFVVVIACAFPAAADVYTLTPSDEPLLRLAMESMDEEWDDAGEMALLAAALPALAAIPPEARAAFAQAHGLDAATVDRAYYHLLGASLAADLWLYPSPEETYRMTQERLLALLSDDGNAREALTEADMMALAAAYALPADFLRYLLTSHVYFVADDDWNEDWDDDWYGIGEGHYKGRGEGHDKDGDGIDDHKGVIIRGGYEQDEDDPRAGKPEKEEKDKQEKQNKKDKKDKQEK